MDLIRGSDTIEARLIEDVQDVLGTVCDLGGLDTLGNAHGQNTPFMEGLTYQRVAKAQITRQRVNLSCWSCLDTLDGVLDLVEQGQHIAEIARIAYGYKVGKDITASGF